MLHIYIDADACPVKTEVYKVAARFHLQVTVVSNAWMRIPNDPLIQRQVVDKGLDVADDWIVEHAMKGDIVITSDIPLAGRCINNGVRVIGNTGKPFTEDNIGDSIATRDLLSDLREAGEFTGGPASLTRKDRSKFLQTLDQVIHSIKQGRSVDQNG